MITASSFFSGTLNTVDAVISNFVHDVYLNFIQNNFDTITLLFTVYIMFLGYQFINHNHHFNLNIVIRKIILMLCVYALVMNWQLYYLFVYNVFTNEPESIAKIFIASADHTQSVANITQVVDGLFAAVTNTAQGLFGQLNFSISGLAFIFYGSIVFVIGSLLCVFALLLFVYAKMMMAVALALGPIFILFLMWDTTKGMFSAWLNILITIALIPIVTSAILVLMLTVINVTLNNVNQPPGEIQFYGLAPFLGLCLTTTLILAQVFRICSALGGGITLSNLSHGYSIGKNALERSGATAAGMAAGKWAGGKAKKVVRRVFK